MAGTRKGPAPGDSGADRLIRALQRGGMAVRASAGGWDIYRDRDRRRRVVGTLDRVAIEALRSTGSLCPLGEGDHILVWSGPLPERDTGARAQTPRAEPLASSTAKAPRRTAMAQVLASITDPDRAMRARNAVLRFNADLHRAATPQSVTMRWDAAGAVDGSRRQGAAGLGSGAAAAARRLGVIRAAIGEAGTAALIALVLHERPLARIAGDADWPVSRAPRELAGLLLRLADAYDRGTR